MPFIRLDRKFFEHDYWKTERSFSFAEAWLDLIYMARFDVKPGRKILASGRYVTINRGEIHASLRFLSTRWKWGQRKVMRFLDNCVKDDEVKRRTEQGESILTLCNYEKYNVKVDADSSTDDSALIIYNQENIIKERAPMTAPMTAPTAANNKKEKNVKKENNVGVDEISNFEEKISNSDVQFPKKEKSCAKKEKDDDNGFEKVWALYERKGNRKTSERKWANLKNHCREAALKHIPLYVASTPDKQYRKNFETYINQECWNDEILERKQVTPPPAEPYVVNIKPINDDE